ncbi:MAG: type I 3-dehydroquinate dehydratase [Calditrichaeota bacterium]|nr:MAG: type I 3-dehydroquinate dehydratase [Calditrichota bacterium]
MSSTTSPELCVSLLPESPEQLRRWMPEAQAADLIEIRVDRLRRIQMANLRALTDRPLIITLRTREEGGFWNGSPQQYVKTLQAAINAGVEYIDLEWKRAEYALPRLKLNNFTRIVLSHHTDERSYTRLREILWQMQETPAEVYKLVFSAETLGDNVTALKLLEDARQAGMKAIIHAVGEAGTLSRLVGAIRGNAWTYVSVDPHQGTAPGQLSLLEAREYYFIPHKAPHTHLLGLVGNPVQQSRGWRLHNYLIEQEFGQAGRGEARTKDFLYVNFPVDHLDEFWADWEEYLYGLSVTIPYKEQVIKFLSEATPEVRISGVCNTLVRTAGGWRGYNTDLMAIETLLRPYREELRNGGVVIGTGATARSAIAALKRLEVSPIFVVGRNEERGKMLANLYGVDFLQEEEVHYAGASGIIQTTPVGMAPNVDQYPVGTSLFRKDRVVLDVIYNPPETRFLQIARERGCVTISGVEMFLLQAAKQFELFTGRAIDLEKVRRAWEMIG